MAIADIFKTYAGVEVKNPQRVTCDEDDVLDDIKATVRENGYNPLVVFPGKPDLPAGTVIPKLMKIHLREDGDGKWRVNDFTFS